MIEITIYKSGFIVEGHAEYAEHGKDIVCSAVSFMAQSVAFSMEKHTDVLIKEKPGLLIVTIPHLRKELEPLMELFKDSMERIAQIYPKNVKITCES